MSAILPAAAIWLTGVGLLLLLCPPRLSRLDLMAETPAAFGAGAMLLYTLFLVVSWFAVMPFWLVALVPCMLVPAVILRARRAGAPVLTSTAAGKAAFPVAGGLVLLLAIQLLLLWPSLGLPLFDWDARILWALKARHLAAEGTLDSAFFRDPYQLHIHPRYPLLAPWLSSLLSRGEGGFAEGHYRLTLLGFSLLTTWQLYLFLVRRASIKVAWTATLVLVLTGGWLRAQYFAQVELALAFFALLALCRIGNWFDSGARHELLLAALFLSAAVMTKNEGLLMTLCAAGALALAAQRKSLSWRLARGAGLLGMVLLMVLPWLLQVTAIPAVKDENYLGRMTVPVLTESWSRLPEILASVARQMSIWPLWHLFWPLSALLTFLVLARWRRSGPSVRCACLLWLGYLAGALVIYGISPWRDINMQIRVTFNRTMLPLLPITLWLLGLMIGKRGPVTRCRARDPRS